MLLSKHKIKNHRRLVLDKQQRIAQLAEIRLNNQTIQIANVHMHWSLFSDVNRLRHITEVIDSTPRPQIILGDFNATPNMKSIKLAFAHYKSSFQYQSFATYPTPLRRPGLRACIRRLAINLGGLLSGNIGKGWQGTIDYIFTDKSLSIKNVSIAFDKSKNDTWASDHFGVFAEILIKYDIDKAKR